MGEEEVTMMESQFKSLIKERDDERNRQQAKHDDEKRDLQAKIDSLRKSNLDLSTDLARTQQEKTQDHDKYEKQFDKMRLDRLYGGTSPTKSSSPNLPRSNGSPQLMTPKI